MNNDATSALCRIGLGRALAAALALFPFAGLAQAPPASRECDPAPARAVSVQGSVETARQGAAGWRPVKLGDAFCPGDSIRAGPRSRADISILGQSVLRLNANSGITVEPPRERSTGVVDLLRGAVHFFSRGPRSLEVRTRFTTAGVRGTEFLVSAEPDRTLLTVFEGTVLAESPLGSLTLGDGQSGIAQAGKPPVLRAVVRPRDAVHWTLYYPPVARYRAGEFPPGTLEKAPADVRDARAHAFRAQYLLGVGAVDEARGEIDRSLQLAPDNADALSLRSVMTLVQGDKEGALQLAQAAVAAAPDSATALIARSYAEQARFDLTAARASAQRATQLEPDNALAWARLAELHSAFGEHDRTLSAARRAAELQPDLSRTQTVLGFANLNAVRLREARQNFEKAIALDQADPLPRLGLGLTKIRGGDLDAGSRDIEIAASLDPGNALVRSYLGKAYYEEKRSPLDQREFAMAKQLDPKDPTPWFYDAVAKQTTNRPAEALQDMQKAQELNENRAVYRSRLLLESDAAARAASQAGIYSDLGFQQRALVEGWEAVNRDPGNFSAHRFLSDSYSVLPRHKIARVSELLQSQLLAPITNTPLQPQLAESNLFLVSSGGPATASFNEFNPLFNRNGANVLLSGVMGEMRTAGAEGVVGGIADRLGYSVGYSKFRTDGFRLNADQDDEIGNAFLQYDLTPQTSAQVEYRKRTTQWGDITQRFLPGFFASQRNAVESDTYRLGARHSTSPASTFLASFIHQDRETTFNLAEPGTPETVVAQKDPQHATGAEVQHLYRANRFNLRTGAGYFDVDLNSQAQVNLVFPFPCPLPGGVCAFDTVTPSSSRHGNAYAYGTLLLPMRVNLIVGASVDSVSSEVANERGHQWNPKLGVIWNLAPSTTLRAATFHVVKRTLITDQTLEPTQVAGFNQFFDDPNFARSRRSGIALDQRFSSSVFGGVELSKRDLSVPWFCGDPTCGEVGPRERMAWKEQMHRAYAFWTPHRFWALHAEYILEKLRRDPSFSADALELDSHRVPLGVRFFHPSGVGASFAATYWKQKGQFGAIAPFTAGNEHFWVADAALSYRLPGRRGLLSIGATNLFDKDFRFFEIDPNNVTIQPRRMLFARVTLALP